MKHTGSEKELIDVFISYGRGQETNDFVDVLEARLTQNGLKVFVDRSDIAPGDVWPDKLARALYSCKAFVAVLTKKYVKSHYCNGELYQAEAQTKQLFPVVFEDGWNSEPSGASVKSVVHRNQFAFFRKGKDDFEKQFGALIGNIRKLTGKCLFSLSSKSLYSSLSVYSLTVSYEIWCMCLKPPNFSLIVESLNLDKSSL